MALYTLPRPNPKIISTQIKSFLFTLKKLSFCSITDVGESINGTVGQVKDAVVGAVHGITHGIDGALHNTSDGVQKLESSITNQSMPSENNGDNVGGTEYTYIPLKDPNNVDEHLQEFKENLLKKAQSFSDDTDKMADDLIKETEDLVKSTTENVESTKENILNDLNTELNNDDKTSTHSLDSLKTNSPEPEIEKALSHSMHKSPPSPEPTLTEMSEIKGDSVPAVPATAQQ